MFCVRPHYLAAMQDGRTIGWSGFAHAEVAHNYVRCAIPVCGKVGGQGLNGGQRCGLEILAKR